MVTIDAGCENTYEYAEACRSPAALHCPPLLSLQTSWRHTCFKHNHRRQNLSRSRASCIHINNKKKQWSQKIGTLVSYINRALTPSTSVKAHRHFRAISVMLSHVHILWTLRNMYSHKIPPFQKHEHRKFLHEKNNFFLVLLVLRCLWGTLA